MPAQRKLSEARRKQILRAAVRVISDRGLCDTRIADIAERAGASAALVIYYFGTKDRLLAEALAYSEEAFYAQAARELAEIPSARGKLARVVELSCSAGAAPGTIILDEWVLWLDIWARAPRDPEVARDRELLDRRWRETIAGIVREGQATGEFGPVDVADFSLRLGALIDGLAIQVVLGDADVTAQRMFDTCMRSAARELGFEWGVRERRTQRATRPKRVAASRSR
jgi:AcrR family transcriptional regulator